MSSECEYDWYWKISACSTEYEAYDFAHSPPNFIFSFFWLGRLIFSVSINGDHSPNFFRQTSLLFHKWLAERFNLEEAWIVNVGYKNTSIYNALITWIGKLCKFVHKQNCSHDFFYCINYNIIVQVDKLLLKQKKLPVLRDIQHGPLLFLNSTVSYTFCSL
jgi:hypothetical protein